MAIGKTIYEGLGVPFVTIYAADAIYMPYFMPMLTSTKAINDYYVTHESPSHGINKVLIKPMKVTDLNDFVLVHNYYYVHWGSGDSQGFVSGKNITVLKRGPSGKLLVYRQMAVHD